MQHSHITTVTKYGATWFGTIDKKAKPGPQKEAFDAGDAKEHKAFVSIEAPPGGGRQFGSYKTYHDMMKAMFSVETNRFAYEIIRGRCKMYFDIESKDPIDVEGFKRRVIEKAFEILDVEIDEDDILVADASGIGEKGPYKGVWKHSYHIVVNNRMVFESNADQAEFVEAGFADLAWVDKSVYGKNQTFRMIGNSKIWSDRALEPVSACDLSDFFVAHLRGSEEAYQLPSILREMVLEKKKAAMDEEEGPMNETSDRDVYNACSISENKLRLAVMSLKDERANEYVSWRSIVINILATANRNGYPEAGVEIAHEFSKKWAAKYNKDAVCDGIAQMQPGDTNGWFWIWCALCKDNKEEPSVIYQCILAPDQLNSRRLLIRFDEKAYKTPAGFFMYNDAKGVWTCDPAEHYGIIERSGAMYVGDRMFMNVYKPAYQLFCAIAPEMPNWLDNNQQAGYLCFRNGVLDMVKYEMKPHSKDYFFTNRIERDFSCDDMEDAKKELLDRVFTKPFHDGALARFMLQKLARCVAGVATIQDREYMTIIGDTSCGKGTMVACMQSALESYCKTFNAENLSITGSHKESERDWTFALNFWDARVAVSSECRLEEEYEQTRFGRKKTIKPLDGNKLKRLVSGGDDIGGRQMYQKAVVFKNKAGIILLLNDIPHISPADEAFLKRALYIECSRTSSSEIAEDTESHFVADPNIKNYVVEPKTSAAFLALMCELYRESCEAPIPRPTCVIEASKERSGANTQGESWVCDNYEIYEGDLEELKLGDGRGYDWEGKAAGWCVSVDAMYDFYQKSGTVTRGGFGKLLKKAGLDIVQRKTRGKKSQWAVGCKVAGR